jgi:hypothetical protein
LCFIEKQFFLSSAFKYLLGEFHHINCKICGYCKRIKIKLKKELEEARLIHKRKKDKKKLSKTKKENRKTNQKDNK